jgi:hypothetical protein
MGFAIRELKVFRRTPIIWVFCQVRMKFILRTNEAGDENAFGFS